MSRASACIWRRWKKPHEVEPKIIMDGQSGQSVPYLSLNELMNKGAKGETK